LAGDAALDLANRVEVDVELGLFGAPELGL
jgi:hypothetical protein